MGNGRILYFGFSLFDAFFNKRDRGFESRLICAPIEDDFLLTQRHKGRERRKKEEEQKREYLK